MRLWDVVDIDADHCLAEAAGDFRDHIGVIVEGGRLDDGRRPLLRIAGLEDSGANERLLQRPSCIIMAASAGVAMPPAVKSTTGSLPNCATSATSS